MLGDIINILNYFGLTKDKVVPLVILGFVIVICTYRMIKPIKKSVSRITNACIEMQTVFESKSVVLRHHLVEAPGSPLQPTEYGKKLIVESGLEKILNDQKELLRAKLLKKLQKNFTEYDVQEKSRLLLIELKGDPIMNPVKEYAYQNGINVDFILKAGGLWLRDDFLGKERIVNED